MSAFLKGHEGGSVELDRVQPFNYLCSHVERRIADQRGPPPRGG